jgi:ABC-type transporter MlaC component
MARKEKPLTCTFFVGGKPIERLTPEQLDRMAERIGEVMSSYYSNHIDEYQNLKKKSRKEF